MSANVINKKQCVTCNKSGAILICDGCQRPFCGKHVNEHRQELGVQLDNVMQERDLLQQELNKPSLEKNPLLNKIDEWERDSIEKIQIAAQNARKYLRDSLDSSKERITKLCQELAENLRSSREADDFSEHDLNRWKQELKDLQSEVVSLSSMKLIQDKNTSVHIDVFKTDEPPSVESTNDDEPPPKTDVSVEDLEERFFQTIGSVTVEEDGYLAKHDGYPGDYGCIRGRFLYSKGCYSIRFKIQKSQEYYRIFFGCMSSQASLIEHAFKSKHAVGWFGSCQVYENGRCDTNVKKYRYNSLRIKTNDILQLILDCDKREMRLVHERERSTCVLPINTNLVPFPWQFLMVLSNPNDSVRILVDS